MGVTLNERTCPNCGGQYLISLDSDFAQCANCGHTDNVDPDFSIHIRRIITEAEQNIHSNSEEGYAEAIRLLRSVPFVPESEDRIVFCETRLDE
nr:hypothetical protein [Clostridiales bacterium]